MNIIKVEKLLQDNNIKVKKKYGQNFLLDENVLKKIATSLDEKSRDNIIEIGPGLGFLTNELVSVSKKVVLYEIDDEMVKYLNTLQYKNALICNIDILKVALDEEIKKHFGDSEVSLVSNLPYYITTPILTKFLTETSRVNKMIVMMQKEVAKRICGKPKTKDYNALSVFIQYYSNAKILFDVSPKSFYPAPDVDSSVVLIERKEIINKAKDDCLFNKFIKECFSQRRKTLINNLSNYSKEKLKQILEIKGYKLSLRAEELSVDELVNLFNELYN